MGGVVREISEVPKGVRVHFIFILSHLLMSSDRLRRVYILFNAKHALNEFDVQMLSHLSSTLISARGTQPFTLQSIITKSDCIPLPQVSQVIEALRKGIWEAAPLCLPPIITSAAMSPPFGVEEVRQNIAEACHLSFSPQKRPNSR
jgi:GTP-binding protein